MFRIKDYRFGFDIWGLVLFILIMLPNFIWFAIPAPDDVLRNESVTPVIDSVAQVFQVVMIASMCVIINKNCNRPMNRQYITGIASFIFIYFLGWIMYYTGIVNALITLDLCIAPCMAFLLFTVARRNIVALTSTCAFMICHVTYGIINFVI